MEVRLFERTSRRIRTAGRMVVRAGNPVHSVLYRVGVFVNASRRMFLLQVEYRARILRVVYVGAIAVLFRFVVMMLNLSETIDVGGKAGRDRKQIYGGMTRRMARVRGSRYMRSSDPRIPTQPTEGETREPYVEWVKRRDPVQGMAGFGQVLYSDGRRYVVSAGMVLLVAMVGSIVLTLKIRTFAMAKRQQIDQQRSRDADRAILRVKAR